MIGTLPRHEADIGHARCNLVRAPSGADDDGLWFHNLICPIELSKYDQSERSTLAFRKSSRL